MDHSDKNGAPEAVRRTGRGRFAAARGVLIFWCLFVGVGAVAGAAGMISDPSGRTLGMDAMLPSFQVLPFADALFQDLLFSGFALLCVNGLPNLLAAWLLLTRRRGGVVCGGLFGVTLMLWICIQFVVFEKNILSTSYFVFGALQALTGHAAWVFQAQERFSVREEDYPHVGSRPGRLVVYFSRMGYTKKAALEAAERSGAALYEIRCTERTSGALGFLWCGRYGLCRWPMPIETPNVDWDAVERLTVCTPVWVFGLSAPVRAFCMAAAGKVRAADYVLLHFSNPPYGNAAREMDRLLGVRAGSVRSVCCRMGRFVRERELRGAEDAAAAVKGVGETDGL